MSMFLNIVSVCGFKYKKILPISLIIIGGIVFMLVCTSGYLPWYYKDVSLEFVDGAAKLVKEYGPLHIVYLIYVLTYFCIMIVTIAHSNNKKKFQNPYTHYKHQNIYFLCVYHKYFHRQFF